MTMEVENKGAENLVNRVAQSGLITIDLKDYLPVQAIETFDIAPHLYKGIVLKESDYREALKNIDWTHYSTKPVAIFCSADAIIPMWAFMLTAVYLQQAGALVHFGTPDVVKAQILLNNINAIDPLTFAGQRVIIKGCADDNVQSPAYVAITAKLQPVVKSLMYGEACSNVPLYKQKVLP